MRWHTERNSFAGGNDFNFQCVALEMLEDHPCGDVIQEHVYTSRELKNEIEAENQPHSKTQERIQFQKANLRVSQIHI